MRTENILEQITKYMVISEDLENDIICIFQRECSRIKPYQANHASFLWDWWNGGIGG